MEPLRWILIAVGIVFIVAIYMLGKNRREQVFSSRGIVDEPHVGDTHMDMDLPEFSANKLDDVDEGVGEVRIISGGDTNAERRCGNADSGDFEENFSAAEASAYKDDGLDDSGSDSMPNDSMSNGSSESFSESFDEAVDNDDEPASPSQPKDIIVVYILPKVDTLLQGAQINSAVQALGLSFGEMNIFHYINEGKTIFSLANMLEPGSFNPETIHDLKTSGLTLFMQIKEGDPMDDLTEMLQRSYQIAGLLEARLCNHKRESLTEQDAENYRAQIRELF